MRKALNQNTRSTNEYYFCNIDPLHILTIFRGLDVNNTLANSNVKKSLYDKTVWEMMDVYGN